MGFIFRTVFWLALALVIIPPQNRLGGDDTADFEHVNVVSELQNAASGAWAFGMSFLKTCNTNPELCKAGQDLANTAVETTTKLAADARNGWQKGVAAPQKTAAAEPHHIKKIQARVE